jgi:hypothetical protein
MTPLSNWRRFSVAAVVAIVLAGPTWVRADGTNPDCYVLSVGVDAYARANKLSGCVTDARDTAARFRAQQGKRFGKVVSWVQIDQQASRQAVGRGLAWLNKAGRAGDFAVLFLSGHGGRTAQKGWYFLPQDYDPQRHSATALTDRTILASADTLAGRGLKVLVIIDACFAGQLHLNGGATLNRHRNPQGGGVVLMLSSLADQTSAALGQYSAFARAVVEALSGEADQNGDGYVTLGELRTFARARTHQLLRQRNMSTRQDGDCHWSPSIGANLRLARTGTRLATPGKGPRLAGTVWVGSERLAGYGKLTFRLQTGNQAVMVDARDTMTGTWRQNGNQVTLTFADGRIVYRGTLSGATLSGTAENGRTNWTWALRRQGAAAASLWQAGGAGGRPVGLPQAA